MLSPSPPLSLGCIASASAMLLFFLFRSEE